MRIRYTVRAAEAAAHLGRFSIDLEALREPTVDLVLPVWVPGSYHVVNYVRGFRSMTASSSDGRPLPVERVEKSRWRVRTEGNASLRVDYTVYGYELVTEAFDLTPEHLFVNAAFCLPYADGHLTEPVEVALDIPSGWSVVTELEEVGRDPPTYRAPDYDTLVDSPIDAGRPVVLSIRPAGIPHRISICGTGGNYESRRLEEDVGKIVEATVRMVGESPLSRYTFFYHLSDVPDGGLEHATSNSCVVRRTGFAPAESYLHFLYLTSHEYFHLYNVKRIRPKVLGPFDYTREVYTRLLWWMEGATDYFAGLILRRAGLFTVPKYLEQRAETAKRLLETPGRRLRSLEEASFVTWVDHYQPFSETPNQSVSYYVKGDVVSMCLDLEIRHRSEGRVSLETVLRTLWTEYGRVGRGLEEDELRDVMERSTGLELGEFFARYVKGTDELDLNRFARYAGLTFGPKPRAPDDDAPVPGYLGVRVEEAGGLVRVSTALTDGPGQAAGLSAGDEIVAINRERVTFGGFDKRMKAYPPGAPVELDLFRRGILERVAVTLGTPPPERYAFLPVEAADELARRVYEGWVGAPWESSPAKPSR